MKAAPGTGQEDLVASSLPLQSSKSRQGKLSGVMNCQTMLHPNTEVVPVTTFSLSPSKALYIPASFSAFASSPDIRMEEKKQICN